MEGVDYAARGNAGAVKKAGKKFVCRYVSLPGNPKNITPAEAAELKKAGLGIVIVFEQDAARALHGSQQGAADAATADAQVKACGLAGIPVFFAVDFDAKPQDQHSINQYLAGAGSVIGKSRVGVYGGYWPVKRAFDAGVVSYGWQTYAWSGGNLDPRAHIYQYRNGQRVAGLSVDLNRSLKPYFGYWVAPDPTKPKVPKPKPQPKLDPGAPRSAREHAWQVWRLKGANPRQRPAWLKTDAPRAWLNRLIVKMTQQ